MTSLEQMERQATDLAPASSSESNWADVHELIEMGATRWAYHWSRIRESGDPVAADAGFYHDSRQPIMVADQAAVTLAATDKALYTAGAFPPLGSGYFSFAGKKLHIRAFGKITTAATPGNGTVDIYFGSGADATGTILVSSAAQTLVASQTNISWSIECWITCRTIGATGSLFAQGTCQFGTAVIAVGTFLLPASAAAAVTVDTTSSNIISVQFKRSGSTAETMTCQDIEVSALS